ncbi:MAG TPA: flagellar biosynthesis protein FlhF [Bacillota bacterium]|nr:flagellar biosynthesis protein FlhF [Bacillota bacterium]
MKTKKIVADSMPLALKMVRQELGENAVIVNTRAVKKGGVFGLFGKKKYEVTAYSMDAAIPPINKKQSVTEPSKKEVKQPVPSSEGLYKKRPNPALIQAQPIKNPTAPTAAATVAENGDKLLDELHQMRKMMMTLMLGEKNGKAFPPAVSKIMERLRKQGVNDEILEYMINVLVEKHESLLGLEESVIKQDFLELVERIIGSRVPKNYTIGEQIRLINVIGPTGVGKTTSIAKLATEQVLKQKRKVGMITTDVYRIAAVEQLKTYAGILNVPIEVVHSADELDEALKKLKSCDLIYMDTTGRNYKEEKYRESIQSFLNHPSESENYLVLSMTTKFEDQKILLDEFLHIPIRNLILTKFDETTSYGSILNIPYLYPYQLVYITNGQSVPEDIARIDPKQMAKLLLGDETRYGSSIESSRIHASIQSTTV